MGEEDDPTVSYVQRIVASSSNPFIQAFIRMWLLSAVETLEPAGPVFHVFSRNW